MVLMPLLSRLLTLLVILTMPLFLARLTLIPIKADRKSGSAGMPRPISYAVFCLKKKIGGLAGACLAGEPEVIAEARAWRKRQGGTLFGLWPNAASGLAS